MRNRLALSADQDQTTQPLTLLAALEGRAVAGTRPLVDSSLLADAIKVGVGIVFLALLAQLRVQIGPVPVTGQTLGVLLLGASYGLSLGAATTLGYLALGALGLPLFAGGAGGWAYLTGPTGGYLVGFVLAAALLGYLARRGWDRRLLSCLLALVLASLAIYLPGLAWLHYGSGLDWQVALSVGLLPFLAGDLVKLAIAAAALPLAWRLVAREN